MKGIISRMFYDAIKHIYRILTEPEYRRFSWYTTRYGLTPRYKTKKLRIHGWDLIVPDVASLLSAYEEIFAEGIYTFNSDKLSPVILDCGANIGISVLFFKHLFPKARIVAYEADPEIFGILEQNIKINGIDGVELFNKAIWSSDGTGEFSVEGADGGRLDVGGDRNIIKTETVSLKSIIQSNHFDFIKIDIEGAEVEALRECGNLLDDVQYVFVEFHSFTHKKQQLGSLISMFENNGFRIHLHPPFTSKKPFVRLKEQLGMDMQLNLFFSRSSYK